MYHNALLEDFYSTLRAIYPRDGAGMSNADWICENTSLRGKKYSFKGYEFQVAIANDMHPQLSVIKPSQIGLTEIQIRKVLTFAARNRGTSTIFSLPNDRMFKRVSKTRIKPLIQNERAFQSLGDEKVPNSMDLYEISGSYVYVTGMTEGDATSIPADMLAHDEVDLSDQRMIGLYQSRLQNSSWRITQKFSTPTHPGFGIDASYQASDQHEYMCVCDACNHWQVPVFDISFLHLPGYDGDERLTGITTDQLSGIRFDEVYVKCERCSARLDVLNPEKRQWVAKFPSRRTRGYRIRPFTTRSLMPEYIFMQLHQMRLLENLKGWYNTVLGEPYSDGSNQLTDELIRRCLKTPNVPEVSKGAAVAIGVDVGQMCHLIVGVIQDDVVHPFIFEIVPVGKLEERIEELCQTYRVVAGAIDRHPYTPTADAIYTKSKRVVVPTEYRGAAFINLKVDEFKALSHCQINRTAAIDRVVNIIRRQEMNIHGYGAYTEVLMAHLKDMHRVETPEKEAVWQKISGNDHFFHALALLQMAPRISQVIAAANPLEVDVRTMIGIVGVNETMDFRKSLPYFTRSPDAKVFP